MLQDTDNTIRSESECWRSEATTSSNVSNGKVCRLCNKELIVGTNCKRGDRKTCSDCINKSKDAKSKKPNTLKCNKCNKYLDYELFTKINKNCKDCLDKAKELRNAKKGDSGNNSQSGSYNVDNYDIRSISIKELYTYLKQKYNVQEPLSDIIKDITSQELEKTGSETGSELDADYSETEETD